MNMPWPAIALGAVLVVAGGALALVLYPRDTLVMIPDAELPRTAAELLERAAGLAQRYPTDPRAHIYYGTSLSAKQDAEGAERELRLALDGARRHAAVFGAQMELVVRGLLATALVEQRRQQEAREVARPLCAIAAGGQEGDATAKILAAYHLCD